MSDRTILVDMDGVLCDWGKRFGEHLDEYGDAAARIPRHHQQTTFNLREVLNANELLILDEVMAAPGFYSDMDPIEGALDAMHEMLASGFDVRIVTSPWVSNPDCASGKLNWVLKHLGMEFAKRTIITSDKTYVTGAILIDDKPEVKGLATPTWEHVLFDQPYNQGLPQRRLKNWANWDYVVMLDGSEDWVAP